TEPNAAPGPEAELPLVDGLHVAVAGEIRWSDATLARLAAERGQSAALAAAWRQRGQGLGGLLGGHFACALIDPERRAVLLATDRMATRPLCYAPVGEHGLVFGASAESVRRHPAARTRVNPQSIYDYVYFHMIPSPATVYAEIARLERASVLLFEDG